MDICHSHNCSLDPHARRQFGVRVRLAAGDPIQNLIGTDFERIHWFASPIERDRALTNMAGEHLYSRCGDKPTLTFEPVDRS